MDSIEDLYLSGIASLKAGNRRLAQAFFKKVIRNNPRHEGAWLWLSEALDDPDDIAYCLEAVLAINPQNDKARLGLELVRKRSAESGRPPRPREWSPLAELRDLDLPAILSQTPPPTPPPPPPAPPRRHPLHFLGRFAIFAGSIVLTLVLVVYMSVTPMGEPLSPTPSPPPPTIDTSYLAAQDRVAIHNYFYQVDLLLGPLRLAHDTYRSRNSVRLGLSELSSINLNLKDEVGRAREGLQKIEPPAPLRPAHQEYLLALALEEEALDNLVRYFETSQVGYANRAAIRFQESSRHFDQVQETWKRWRDQFGIPEPTRLPTLPMPSLPTRGPSPTPTPTLTPRPTPTPTYFPTRPIG